MFTPTPSEYTGRKSCAADRAAQLYGLVLAGGEGQRLRSFVKRLRGDALPKQYVNFSGSGSMLEHTYSRAEKLIPPERLLTIVNQSHLSFPEVNEQLCGRAPGTVIVNRPIARLAPACFCRLPIFTNVTLTLSSRFSRRINLS